LQEVVKEGIVTGHWLVLLVHFRIAARDQEG
jgi:hypothetical protein